LRPKLFAAVPRDKLQEQVAGLHDWVSGKRSDASQEKVFWLWLATLG
jgi:hypothetical protein